MPRPVPANLKELFSYRLNRLAEVSSLIGAQANQTRYELGARDWRIIGLLGAFAPMSLNALAQEAGVDKSQASRSVSDLIARGYIKRDVDAADGRGVSLTLSREGRALYRRVFPKAVERNESMLAVLSAQERDVLERALDKLSTHAADLLADAEAKAARKRTSATR